VRKKFGGQKIFFPALSVLRHTAKSPLHRVLRRRLGTRAAMGVFLILTFLKLFLKIAPQKYYLQI
jgi:hypothetical protein